MAKYSQFFLLLPIMKQLNKLIKLLVIPEKYSKIN